MNCFRIIFVLLYMKSLCESKSVKDGAKTSGNYTIDLENESEDKIKYCTTRSGLRGKCMARSDCADKDVESLIDARILTQFPKECESEQDVCCKYPSSSTKSYSNNAKCGQRKYFPNHRVLGNTNTEFAEAPWMVAILVIELAFDDQPVITTYLCGGSLIHPKVIMTASHCVIPHENSEKPKLIVRAGDWNSMILTEPLPYQERIVEKIIVHEWFHPTALHNDIALLLLKAPFDVAGSDNVAVVCLPQTRNDGLDNGCLATGWGQDGERGKPQFVLKKVELPLVGRDECQASLRTTMLGPYFRLHESFVCAGGRRGRDTCRGDGGSPLVCPIQEISEQFLQIGIVAWGIGCGDEGVPGVYVNVRLFLPWIMDHLAKNGIDMAPYSY